MHLALLLVLANGHAPPAISSQLQSQAVQVVSGRLSVYHPNDGFNRGVLSCSGITPIKFTWEQNHIAFRRWRRMGCGRRVLVCAKMTGRCVVSKVRDAGPYGIYTGRLRGAVKDGRWKVWVKRYPPKGWKWRAAVDLSYGLWRRLGSPASLTDVTLHFLPKGRRDVYGRVPAA